MPIKQKVLIEYADKGVVNPLVADVQSDEYAIEVIGPADAVKRMTDWLHMALREGNRQDELAFMLQPRWFIEFPQVGPELWRVSKTMTDELARLEADIRDRLKDAKKQLAAVIKNYKTAPAVSLLASVHRVQKRLAELSHDMFILELEKRTSNKA